MEQESRLRLIGLGNDPGRICEGLHRLVGISAISLRVFKSPGKEAIIAAGTPREMTYAKRYYESVGAETRQEPNSPTCVNGCANVVSVRSGRTSLTEISDILNNPRFRIPDIETYLKMRWLPPGEYCFDCCGFACYPFGQGNWIQIHENGMSEWKYAERKDMAVSYL